MSNAFQCKETVVQENTNNGRKSESNSSEKKDSIVFTRPTSDMPWNFFIESMLKGKTDVSVNEKYIFPSRTDGIYMKWYKMFLLPVKVLHFLQLSAYSCMDSLNVVLLLISWRWCLFFPCLLFAGKKNTAARSFILKLFKHWPDGTDAFKRHIDPEHGVHNKCMFDYDQLISRLKSTNISVDVSVNSLRNEKVLYNIKIILAITDIIKLCSRLRIALRGDSDASKYQPKIGHVPTSAGVGNFVHIINHAARNSNKDFENYLKTCSRRETYLPAITQNDLRKCCYQVITKGLLKEVNVSKIFALILDEASNMSNKEQLSFCSTF